jgi:hypothetical protein
MGIFTKKANVNVNARNEGIGVLKEMANLSVLKLAKQKSSLIKRGREAAIVYIIR